MSKTLDDLLASPSVGLPECTYELCLSQPLRARRERLFRELQVLEDEHADRDDDGNLAGRTRRLSEGEDPRVAAKRAEYEATVQEAREHSGTILLRAIDSGSWQRWKDVNPPRTRGFDQKGRPAVIEDDEVHAYGRCDASALLARLGDFVVSWDGVDVTPSQWEKLTKVAPPGGLLECVAKVVGLHETGGIGALPFSYTASSATETSATE